MRQNARETWRQTFSHRKWSYSLLPRTVSGWFHTKISWLLKQVVILSTSSHSKWCPLAIGIQYTYMYVYLFAYLHIIISVVHGIEVFSMGIRQTELLLRFAQNDDLIHIEISFFPVLWFLRFPLIFTYFLKPQKRKGRKENQHLFIDLSIQFF